MSVINRLVPACLVALVLSGCAAKSVRSDFSLTPDSQQGIVVLSVSHDEDVPRSAKAIFHLDGRDAHLESIGNAVPGLMIPGGSDFEDVRGRLFVLALPAGPHAITGWQIFNGTGMWIRPTTPPQPLRFDVTRGKVIYLGNLHTHMATGKNVFGMTIVGDGYPEVMDQRTRDLDLLASKYPQFKDAAEIKLLPIGSWRQTTETSKQVDIPPLPAPLPVR